ncbi:MAG TPA: glycosyltransferase family 4 protein [Opitutus sp.]|nr:glycosyltransferase family 4 protein [Opitutus sp.]
MIPALSALPQRVLMTADTVGGVLTYALDLCRGLVARDVHVILATMGGPLPAHARETLAALGHRVHVHESDYRLEWMDDPWADVDTAGEWLLELECEYAPHLIHLNGYAHAALPWSAPILVVAHSCVYSWWRAVKQSAPPESWHRYHAAVRRGLEHADLVVAPSHAMLATLEHNYGCTTNGRVIHNGRSPVTDPGPRGRPRCIAPGTRSPFILSVGRLWDEAKNAAALAAVASELPWPVRLAGDVRAPDGCAGVNFANVELLGQRPPAELARDYERAAIYALPARYEPFGLSALEAAGAGCALVLGDIPSLRELWHDAAVFVPPEDTAALREALVRLVEDEAQRAALGLLASARARQFTADRMTDGYLEAYGELMAATQRDVVFAGSDSAGSSYAAPPVRP